jgi:hypothetical protein
MKPIILILFTCVVYGFTSNNGLNNSTGSCSGQKESLQESTGTDDSAELSFENTDHDLLNKTVFQLINQERRKRKVDTVAFNSSLYQVARKNQSLLEFRTFKNGVKIQSKINKNLQKTAKETGFKGGLTTSVAAECNAINYTKGKPFFHLKNDQENKLGLYYGAKKDLKNPDITVRKIPNYTYYQFAQALLKSLTSKQKKILHNKSYREMGLQLNWYYKSLHKRRIPQIKVVIIMGGYITAGVRK